MANSSYFVINTETQEPMNIRLIDKGDDTYAISVSGDRGLGSSIGGGNSVYSNVQGDFTATANSGAKTIPLAEIPKAAVPFNVLKTGFKFGSAGHLVWGFAENGADGYGFTGFTISPVRTPQTYQMLRAYS